MHSSSGYSNFINLSVWSALICSFPGDSNIHTDFRSTTLSHIPPCRITGSSNFVHTTNSFFTIVFPIYVSISDVWGCVAISPVCCLVLVIHVFSLPLFWLVLLGNYQCYEYFQRINLPLMIFFILHFLSNPLNSIFLLFYFLFHASF